ncbi:MAG: hypothetical protein KME32_36325 [Mojavia pulchra JT2-VF2]|jgi:predicted DNA-binding protein (UPF0278 family)|uniref:Mobilization protein MobC n=1 Tax=Mojavia pulchra JT2-VF2 TaxID=287848 RepID=A0A951Q5I5_9NOST|nr:hypothetical protein [Mojavia pulchra JT2-VF2]
MVRTKPGQKIPLEKVQTTLSELEKLEDKAKEELSLRESISFLREKLQSALKKGYSYQDLSLILAKQEIKISAATLKQYLTEIEREKRSRKRGAKSEQVKQADSVTENLPADDANVEEGTLTSDSTKSVSDVVDAAVASQQEQSSKELQEPSEKITKGSKRQTPKTPSSKDDISSDFNQY